MAWSLEIETGSILIKEKCKHLSKMSDWVSKELKRKCLKWVFRERSHRSIYRYTKFIRYRILLIKLNKGDITYYDITYNINKCNITHM